MSSQEDSQRSQDSTMTLMQENRHEVLYFAYGSNLSTEQMRRRCPYSTPVGLAHLKGWKWFINGRGYANVQPIAEDSDGEGESSRGKGKGKGKAVASDEMGVYGLLYLVPPEDEERLDRYEGVPDCYEKFQVDVKWARDGGPADDGDESVRALIYVDQLRVAEDDPREEYIDRMERGIEDVVDNWGMDEKYADLVMRRFWPEE